ncbi:MAG TPA: NADPH-dependent FMN reductase [Holophagaceae bacterium]|nr:NADPH-dependent FMN reductase [Holophagaceae bacterium]
MKLVVLGGSLRPASLNRRLLNHVARVLAEKGHEVARFEGEALRLPLYEDDVAAPGSAVAMQAAMLGAQGLVVVSPEYNQGIPGHLKNVVDWLSTLHPSPWTGLPVLLCAASPGAFGGARAMLSWRATLANMGAFAHPGALPIPHADVNLAEDGTPVEERTRQLVPHVLDQFLHFASLLKQV